MNPKIISTTDYESLPDAEVDMRKSMPKILYKYRDWGDVNHQMTLTVPSIWFSHPKTLNDPFDIRVPERVNYGDPNSEQFYQKIKDVIKYVHPEFPVDSRDYNIACGNLLDIIKADPKSWFEKNQKAIRDSHLFDNIGVFSLSTNALSESLWGYYGNSGKGFCVGYDPVEIYKTHPCSFAKVYYSDDQIERDLLEPVDDFNSFWNFFRKQTRWQTEEEYRFVTMFIQKNSDRNMVVPLKAINEVVLGYSISNSHQQEIISVLKQRFFSKVPLYKVEPNVSSFGMEKKLISY